MLLSSLQCPCVHVWSAHHKNTHMSCIQVTAALGMQTALHLHVKTERHGADGQTKCSAKHALKGHADSCIALSLHVLGQNLQINHGSLPGLPEGCSSWVHWTHAHNLASLCGEHRRAEVGKAELTCGQYQKLPEMGAPWMWVMRHSLSSCDDVCQSN